MSILRIYRNFVNIEKFQIDELSGYIGIFRGIILIPNHTTPCKNCTGLVVSKGSIRELVQCRRLSSDKAQGAPAVFGAAPQDPRVLDRGLGREHFA